MTKSRCPSNRAHPVNNLLRQVAASHLSSLAMEDNAIGSVKAQISFAEKRSSVLQVTLSAVENVRVVR